MKRVKAQLGARTRRPSKQKVAAVIGRLFLVDDHLPSKLRRQILELGPLAVPFLCEMLFDPRDVEEPVPGPGKFPLHAIRLLGELGAREAVPGLVAFQEQVFPESPLARAIEEALAAIQAAESTEGEAEPEQEEAADEDEDPRARLLALARQIAGQEP